MNSVFRNNSKNSNDSIKLIWYSESAQNTGLEMSIKKNLSFFPNFFVVKMMTLHHKFGYSLGNNGARQKPFADLKCMDNTDLENILWTINIFFLIFFPLKNIPDLQNAFKRDLRY